MKSVWKKKSSRSNRQREQRLWFTAEGSLLDKHRIEFIPLFSLPNPYLKKEDNKNESIQKKKNLRSKRKREQRL